ncbi:MAG: cardiolipin synthetase [Sphingomonas sp.]|nr:cardiolipin synthetase [Sphingomonas sp.]
MQAPPEQPTFTVEGNRLTLLDTGPRRLDALLSLIANARRSLRVLYYIYVDDSVGTRVRDAMIAAIGRGVEGSLIVDALGSDKADDHHFFEPLRAAGAEVSRFVPRLGRRYLLRNHQKMAIADESCAIIGGFNIQDSYFGTVADQAWRDLGLLIDGPLADRLAGYYDALERWPRRERAPLRALSRTLGTWSEASGKTRWLFGGPTHRLSPWARTIKREIDRADSIDMIAGYFAPGPSMLRRLDKAGKRGRVRIVLPSKNDHGAAIWASRFTYAGLLRKGVKIYEYQPTKLHTKLFVIGDAVYIGSANFDVRSMFLNLEMMLRVEDPVFAAHVRAYVEIEIAESAEITREYYKQFTTPWRRMKQATAYFVMAILDYNVTRGLNFGDE